MNLARDFMISLCASKDLSSSDRHSAGNPHRYYTVAGENSQE